MNIDFLIKNDNVTLFRDKKKYIRAVKIDDVVILTPPSVITLLNIYHTLSYENSISEGKLDTVSSESHITQVIEDLDLSISEKTDTHYLVYHEESDANIMFEILLPRENEQSYSTEYFTHPFRSDEFSYLETVKYIKLVTAHLKFFTLYLYANYGDVQYTIDENSFGMYNHDSKIISESSYLDFTDPELPKLFIDNEETQKRLDQFLSITLLTSPNSIQRFKNKVNVDDMVFSEKQNTILFSSSRSLKEWIETRKNKNPYEIYSDSLVVAPKILNTDILNTQPYFFIKPAVFQGKLLLIQNTESKNKAIEICYEWNQSQTNCGYFGCNLDKKKIEQLEATTRIFEIENGELKEPDSKLNENGINILKNADNYAAILLFYKRV